MRTRKRLLTLAAALTLGGLLLWSVSLILATESDVVRGASPAPPGDLHARSAELDPSGDSEERSPEVAQAPGLLHLRVLDANGAPARGNLHWTTSATPPQTSSMLAPESAYSLPPEASSMEHGGSADLTIPPGHWTWLRATGAGFVSAYERLQPFAGEKELVVKLSPSTRGLHVFLLESDLARAAAHREVMVYHSDIRTGGPPAVVGRQETDAWGYARFRGLEPGGFLVCAPGTKPGAPPPHTARVILPAGMPTTEMPVTVVVPEKTYEIELKVTASFSKGLGPMAPKLYLKRLYRRMGQLFPAAGVVSKRTQVEKLRVPEGLYELGVQPLGSMRILSGPRAIDVKPGGERSFELLLEQNEVETEVTLHGLPEYPVTVYPRPAEGIWDGNHDLYFCGPHRWRSNPQKVCGPSDPSWLVVSGKARFWISKSPVRLAGGKLGVELAEASRMEVRWHDQGKLESSSSYLIEVVSGLGKHAFSLKPLLVQRNGAFLPTLSGVFVVPRGPVRLTCLDSDSGQELWTRRVQADRAYLTVSVEDDR